MVNKGIVTLLLAGSFFSVAHADLVNQTSDFKLPVHLENKHIKTHLASDIIVVKTCADLQAMNTDLDADYIQTKDINCSEFSGFTPIGTQHMPFTGSFTGQDHHIAHLGIYYTEGEAGLFGYTQDAQINNVRLKDVTVIGGNYSTGALVGSLNRSLVFFSEVSGQVSSTAANVGGMVGQAHDSALLYVSARGLVIGETNVGGLAGHAADSGIYDSYSANTVDGLHNVAGLVGLLTNHSEVMDTFSIGPVNGLVHAGGLIGKNQMSSVEASFWDKKTSNQENSDGGLGYTTKRMQNPLTYSGWDDQIWYFVEGNYPVLLWQFESN